MGPVYLGDDRRTRHSRERDRDSLVDIITFRLNPGDRMAYVGPPKSYQDALALARRTFPDELSAVRPDRIFFQIKTTMGGMQGPQPVHITPTAWLPIIHNCQKYDTIDVVVVPEVVVVDTDAPPLLLSPPQYDSLDRKFAPDSKPSSREGSPSRRPKSHSPSPKERVKESVIAFIERL